MRFERMAERIDAAVTKLTDPLTESGVPPLAWLGNHVYGRIDDTLVMVEKIADRIPVTFASENAIRERVLASGKLAFELGQDSVAYGRPKRSPYVPRPQQRHLHAVQ